jgi:hypothetical protein
MPIYIMAGYENLIYGDAIKSFGGKDGILPKDLKK